MATLAALLTLLCLTVAVALTHDSRRRPLSPPVTITPQSSSKVAPPTPAMRASSDAGTSAAGPPPNLDWAPAAQRADIINAVSSAASDWANTHWAKNYRQQEDSWVTAVAPYQTPALTAANRNQIAKAQDHNPWDEFVNQQCTSTAVDVATSVPQNYGRPGGQFTPTITSQYVYVTATIDTVCHSPDPTQPTPLPYTTRDLLHLVLEGDRWLVTTATQT